MPINTENPIQIIRGDKASISARTGKDGEPNWATDTHELFIHDGVTPGGHKVGGGLDASSVDNTTISAEDGVLSVIPGGIIDNDTIVVDENGKLTSKSIPYSKAEQQLFTTSSFNIQSVVSEFLVLPWPEAISQSGTSLFSRSSSGNLSAVKQGIYHVSIELAIFGEASQQADGWVYLYKNDQQYNCGTFRLNGQNYNPDTYNFSADIPFEIGDEFIIQYAFPIQTDSLKVHYLNANILRYPVNTESDGYPVGTIFWSASSTPPEGGLLCNGAAVGRTTYPDLFDAIGTTYGAGDGSTTFNLPNLIGRVAWGGAIPGQYLEAGLPNLVGNSDSVGYSGKPYHPDGVFAKSDVEWEGGSIQIAAATEVDGAHVIKFDASDSSSIYGNSTTVQPPALTLVPYIKAFSAATNPGEVNVTELANKLLPFTPPTAEAPGKEGLVPQPQATDPSVQINNILTMLGWRSISEACLSYDRSSDASNILVASATDLDASSPDANTIASGAYSANTWKNTPASSGFLLSYQLPIGEGNYGAFQIFLTYIGHCSYRATIGSGVLKGEAPKASNWHPWITIGAPKPQAAAGVGQMVDLQRPGGTVTYVIPAGGTWYYWCIWESGDTGNPVAANKSGFIAGGGTLSPPADSGAIRMRGWAWRIQ